MERPATDAPQTDEDLLRRLQAHDDQALSELYDRYGGLAFALAYRILDDRGQAEDVVQEAFLSVWRRASRFDPARGRARSWLLTIVRNAAIDRRRGRFRHQRHEQTIYDYVYRLSGSPDEVWGNVREQIDRETVRAALAELPEEQRRIIELAYFGGLTEVEIAEATGVPLGTVKSCARLGLRKLEQRLRSQMTVNEPDEDA